MANATRPPTVSLGELFFGFMKLSLSGFGGVLIWAHRILVEERRWLTQQEFTDALSLCQFLPGPNIVNMSIYLGQRFHGARGALVAIAGLLLPPLAIVLALGALYSYSGQVAIVHEALRGVSAVAAGLMLTMGIKLAWPLRRRGLGVLVALFAFAGVGFLQWPLLPVLLALAPASVVAHGVRWR